MNNLIISDRLDEVSESFCMAKWNMVSLHLTNGKTHSCYHNPTHNIPLEGLENNPGLLHNTETKIQHRQEMRDGKKPSACSYCWKIEDLGHKSDRHFRADEWWNATDFEKIKDGGKLIDETITPAYVEVNFNQACNFKCMYCSPHLSTSWEDEIKTYGSYDLPGGGKHNDINALTRLELMPIKVAQKDNPYVQAFWNWWPTVYPNLKIFRMTGGEPLMDKNTFKVLDYVIENPNSDLEISITSNMCPPKQELFDKFVKKIQDIEKIKIWHDPLKVNKHTNNNYYIGTSCKHIMLYVSCDTLGKQAEYIRTGLDFDRLNENLNAFLDNTNNTTVSMINTFNLFSIPKLRDYLQWILDLREKYSYENQKKISLEVPDSHGRKHDDIIIPKSKKIWFDMPLLEDPKWFSIKLGADFNYFTDIMEECILFMQQNKTKGNFTGFEEYEIQNLIRNYDHMKSYIDPDQKKWYYKSLIGFIEQMDARRELQFKECFPELEFFYNQIKADNRD